MSEEVEIANSVSLSSSHRRGRHRHHHLPPSIPSIQTFLKKVNMPNSCLIEKTSEFNALFLPSTLSEPLVAAQECLSELLHSFISCNDRCLLNRQSSGLLMAFDPNSLHIPPFGFVVDDIPAFSVRFTCRVLLFSPTIGDELEVEVRDVRYDHLVCIAHNVFNVLVVQQSPLTTENSQRSKRKRKQQDTTSDLFPNSLLALTDEFSAASPSTASKSPSDPSGNAANTHLQTWGVSVADRVLVRVTEVDLSVQPIPHIAAVLS